jgi:hypothetical protein
MTQASGRRRSTLWIAQSLQTCNGERALLQVMRREHDSIRDGGLCM